ncbi:hypothetical protein Aperf_G00000012290 [Anoplocephala perfoliata]
MPQPTGASLLDTIKPDSIDGEDVQLKTFIEDDVEISDPVVNFIRKGIRRPCTCGSTLFQKKFCSNDFAIIAKKSSEETQRFFPDPDWEDFRYAGLAVPLEVQQVLRGSVGPDKNIVIRFVQGSSCGVLRDKIPDSGKAYILTGFRETIKKYNGRETKEILLVTKCSISEPLESLSLTQLSGFFMNWYCGLGTCGTEVYYEDSPRNSSRGKEKCFYPFEGRECYNRYTICAEYPPTWVCSPLSVNRLPPTENVLQKFPPELRWKIKEAYDSRMTDGHRFAECLTQLGLTVPPEAPPLIRFTSSCPPQILPYPLVVTLPLLRIYSYLFSHF